MSMNFSVNLFGDDLEDYVKYEKLAVGCDILIDLDSIARKSVNEVRLMKEQINTFYNNVSKFQVTHRGLEVKCGFGEMNYVETIGDMAREWEHQINMFKQFLEKYDIYCSWELTLNVSVTTGLLEEYNPYNNDNHLNF